MHIIKPDTLGLMVRTLPREGGFALVVSAYACFPLNQGAAGELLFETRMWQQLRKALNEKDVFDHGFPKPNAEFLLYGRCFPPEPCPGMEVSAAVGGLRKTVQVMGERFWEGGHYSDPAPVRPVRLDWTQAYGGPDFPQNPLGKGHSTGKKAARPAAPALLHPGELLREPGKEHQPVSFTAIPPFWPQRTGLLGQFDELWHLEDWPYLPRASKAAFFCSAQPDQRFDGFLNGDETIEIRGAHPQRQVIRSALPGLRARMFALTNPAGRERFCEIPNLADTLWLLPEQELGIVCYRGVLRGVDEDANDVAHLLADWEALASPPEAETYYRQLLQDALAAPEAQDAAPEPEPEPAPAPAPGPGTAPPSPPDMPDMPDMPDIPGMQNLRQQLRELESALDATLAKHNLSKEAVEAFVEKQTPAPAAPGKALAPDELDALLAGLRQQVDALLARKGLQPADVDAFLAKSQPKEPAPEEARALLDKALASGRLSPQQREGLLELKKAGQALEKLQQAPAPGSQDSPQDSPDSPQTDADTPEKAPPHAEPAAGRDLANADFHGQDLTGADFGNAILENADFSNAMLQGANFTNAILTNANFTNANLSDARFNGASATGANFCGAQLIGADLRHGDFSQSDFSTAFFYRAWLDFADCGKANLLQSQIHFCRAQRASFTEANLTDVNFCGSWLKRAAFGKAILHHATFSECLADGAEFYEAHGTGVAIRRTSLVNSRADAKTRLQKLSLAHVNLSKARWSGANLNGARFWNVLLDGGDFSKTQLEDSTLIRVSSKGATLAKARIANANLRRINLFRGSLRKARIITIRASTSPTCLR